MNDEGAGDAAQPEESKEAAPKAKPATGAEEKVFDRMVKIKPKTKLK